MNSHARVFSRALLVGVIAVFFVTAASAQTEVGVNLRLPNYDILYPSDLYNFETRSLTSAIPNIGIELTAIPANFQYNVVMRITLQIRFAGDAAPSNLLTTTTGAFSFQGTKIISARDLVRGATSGIPRGSSTTNRSVQDRLEDLIQESTTLPVGNYTIIVELFTNNNNQPGQLLGRDSKTLEIRNTSVGEFSITLLEPQDGAEVASLLPTFSWSAERPRARLKVYEKLPHLQSPQDAVTGIPHLNIEVTGSVFTYPPNARNLEVGKTYFWLVETIVTSNRGEEVKQSEIRSFRSSTTASVSSVSRSSTR